VTSTPLHRRFKMFRHRIAFNVHQP
jgi:hypothetical protein